METVELPTELDREYEALRLAVRPILEAAEAFHYDGIEGEADPEQARADYLADERCSFLRKSVERAAMQVVAQARVDAAREQHCEWTSLPCRRGEALAAAEALLARVKEER